MKFLATCLVVWSLSIAAEEPGQYQIETPPSSPPPPSRHRARDPAPAPQALLSARFAQARGLKSYEIQTMHYNRVSCARHLFSPTGLSVEGDGDIKASQVEPDFMEIEFPTHFSFESFGVRNPFQNGISEVETVHGRQLIAVRDWIDGQPLKLKKFVTVSYSEENVPPKMTAATDEVRVMDGTYPSTYLVRETIQADQAFSLYFICQ